MPLIVAAPALLPVTVDPETEAIVASLDWKLPPLKPVGAEAVVVWPTFIELDNKLTVPLGQLPALTVYVSVSVWGELSALESEIVTLQMKEPTLEGASIETVIVRLPPALMLPEFELMWHQP